MSFWWFIRFEVTRNLVLVIYFDLFGYENSRYKTKFTRIGRKQLLNVLFELHFEERYERRKHYGTFVIATNKTGLATRYQMFRVAYFIHEFV